MYCATNFAARQSSLISGAAAVCNLTVPASAGQNEMSVGVTVLILSLPVHKIKVTREL